MSKYLINSPYANGCIISKVYSSYFDSDSPTENYLADWMDRRLQWRESNALYRLLNIIAKQIKTGPFYYKDTIIMVSDLQKLFNELKLACDDFMGTNFVEAYTNERAAVRVSIPATMELEMASDFIPLAERDWPATTGTN